MSYLVPEYVYVCGVRVGLVFCNEDFNRRTNRWRTEEIKTKINRRDVESISRIIATAPDGSTVKWLSGDDTRATRKCKWTNYPPQTICPTHLDLVRWTRLAWLNYVHVTHSERATVLYQWQIIIAGNLFIWIFDDEESALNKYLFAPASLSSALLSGDATATRTTQKKHCTQRCSQSRSDE